MTKHIRSVCVVVHSRANYGRIKSVLSAIKSHPKLELQLIVASSALLSRYGNVSEIINSDGYKIDMKIHTVIEGETPLVMAKSTGMAISELASAFDNLKPDIVLTVADRYETMATAIAASYMNIPLAHTQGGEVTGSIDESVRHAITKLAHVHFPATKRSEQFIIRMGEAPDKVFLTGCPALDIINDVDLNTISDDSFMNVGVGLKIDISKPYLLVLQHPVTTEYGAGMAQIQETLNAVIDTDIQTIWLWPNIDAGAEDISKGLRIFRESCVSNKIHFYKNFSVENYLKLLNNTKCIIGNSSSAIREGAFLGIPAVNIGNRQNYRELADNVITVKNLASDIYDAIQHQLKHGKYQSSTLYGNGYAGIKISTVLSTVDLNVQKHLNYVNTNTVDLCSITN